MHGVYTPPIPLNRQRPVLSKMSCLVLGAVSPTTLVSSVSSLEMRDALYVQEVYLIQVLLDNNSGGQIILKHFFHLIVFFNVLLNFSHKVPFKCAPQVHGNNN